MKHDVTLVEALDALALLFHQYDRPDIEKAGNELAAEQEKARKLGKVVHPPRGMEKAFRTIQVHHRARGVLKRAGRL